MSLTMKNRKSDLKFQAVSDVGKLVIRLTRNNLYERDFIG